jgi:hypothetical protein
MDTVINISPDIKRSKLTIVQDWLKDKMGMRNPVINTDFLRLSVALKVDSNDYEIGVKTNDTVDYVLDKKLANDDIFFITDIAILLSKEGEGSEANGILFAYPDSAYFSETDATKVNADEWKALMTVYGGKLGLTDNHDKRFYNMPMLPFLNVPQVQFQQPATGAPTLPAFKLDDVLQPMNPFEIVSGAANSKFAIKVGAGNRALISDGGKNRVNIICAGFKVANAASDYAAYIARQAK